MSKSAKIAIDAGAIKASGREVMIVAALCLLLTGGIIAVYAQTAGFALLAYDDTTYVIMNQHVLAGLTPDGVKWAFTTMQGGNWHPLVWLSLMLDRTWDAGKGGLHLVNVTFHIINTVLLFWVLRRYTKAVWASFFAAALFALHPLHVESVAWVSERKDVLSAMFWLLTMLAYLRYVERRTAGRYVMLVVTFALGLMSKSMLVTLPFVLLLMDYWLLERFGKTKMPAGLIIEKLPLVVLSAVICVVTVIAQKSSGSVMKMSIVPLSQRIGNTFTAYCQYLMKTFWPADLAVFYPHPLKYLDIWQIVMSLAALVVITTVVILLRRRYLLAGWLWYLGTLVPVIGLVQVGSQALADRYTYIPLTGIFIMLAWGAGDIVGQNRTRRIIAGICGAVIIVVLGVMTFIQVGYWRDTITLFQRCEAVTRDNFVLRAYLGIGYAEKNDYELAIHAFEGALKFEPNDVRSLYNIGTMRLRQGRADEAIAAYEQVVRLDPANDSARMGIEKALAMKRGEPPKQ